MMYSREIFGKELKQKVIDKQPVDEIGSWAYTLYLEHIMDLDFDFLSILLHLNTMEDGPEFAFSYEEPIQIAEDFIAGKDVKL